MNSDLSKCLLLLVLGLITVPAAWAQTATVSGVVTDADTGDTLPGTHVFVVGTTKGTVTDMGGRYALTDLAPGAHTLTYSFAGYQSQDVAVTLAVGETQTIDVALSAGIELDPIQVTAGRKQEKALDAPASISVVDAREIEQNVGTSSVTVLRNTTGVDMSQTGVDRREMVLRGFNNAFSGATYVLTDYRQSAVPSLGVNIYSLMPNMTIDLERVEVVRGPGSALYGAGVDAGVVHFFTKDPFQFPGTTVAVSGGERSYFSLEGRHAGVINEKLGYKVTGVYGQAEDWELDPDDPLDAVTLGREEIDRNNDFEKVNVNGTLEYRFNDNTSLIANGGYSSLTATVLSGIGTVQADGFGYTYGQLRFQSGAFFAQAYFNRNDAGESFVYDSGQSVVDNGMLYNAQAQYDLMLANGKQQIIVGADLEMTRPDTEGTILGRNEDNDETNAYGAYVQSTTTLTNALELTAALRGDWNNVNEVFRLSPRAGIVYKPAPGNSVRATYNLAFSSPGTNSNFLDIVAGQTSGITVRGRGSAQGFTWERNPAYAQLPGSTTDLVASSLNPATLGQPQPVGMPLDALYGQIHQGLTEIPAPQLIALLAQNGINVDEQTLGFLVNQLAPANTQVQGFSPGVMGIVNPTTLQMDTFPEDLVDIDPLAQTITQTVEVGYKGLFRNRVLLAVDAYVSNKKNFVGPLLMETPFVLVPGLRQNLMAALTTGIQNNAQLAGALAQLGLNAQAVANLIVTLADSDLPDPARPIVAIVQPAENNPGVGEVPELMLSYRNFGNITYYGVDAAFQVIATERVNVFGNISWISDDFFDNEELDEENSSLSLALNAPTFKLKAGGSYTVPRSFSVNAAARFVRGFPVRSGPYIGDVEDYFLLDLGAGYDFADTVPGLRLDVGVTNVLDNDHREFIGAPKLGRMAIARLTYTL